MKINLPLTGVFLSFSLRYREGARKHLRAGQCVAPSLPSPQRFGVTLRLAEALVHLFDPMGRVLAQNIPFVFLLSWF